MFIFCGKSIIFKNVWCKLIDWLIVVDCCIWLYVEVNCSVVLVGEIVWEVLWNVIR